MTGPPEITSEDFNRLLRERFATKGDQDTWFEKNRISEDVFEAIVNSARKETPRLMIMGLLEKDDGEGINEILQNVCATMMMAGFELGWEAHKQFRSGP